MINWDDFNYDDINWEKFNDGMWTSNSTGPVYNPDDYMMGKSEEELEYETYNNTYEVLVGINTVENIERNSNTARFLFDPNSYNIFHCKEKLIKELIDYFEEIEEYEKCEKLIKIK